MSGLEVVGVVLGAFPIALVVLDEYAEVARRLGRFRRTRLEYKRCRDALKFHHLTFTRQLRQLLLSLPVDDDKVDELLSTPGGDSWKEPTVETLLQKRPFDCYKLYLDHVTEMKRVLGEIYEELAVNKEPIQQQIHTQKDLSGTARLKAAISGERWAYLFYRFKFSNRETTLNRLFAELKDYNDKLESLLHSTDKDTHLVQQRASGAKPANIDTAVCNFWVQAKRLFEALASAWQCQCPQHAAKLLLQHRTDQSLEFQVVFTNALSSRWEMWKTRISGTAETSMKESAAILEGPTHSPSHRQTRQLKSALRDKSATTSGVKLLLVDFYSSVTKVFQANRYLRQIPTIAIQDVCTSTSPGRLGLARPIGNLCASLSQAEGICCGYLAGQDDCRYYVYMKARQSADTLSFVTLDQILRGEVLPQPSRSQRYTLSLIVASSFLQLLDSDWLPEAFKKTDVLFVPDAENPNMFALDQPHISRTFVTRIASAPEPSAEKQPGFNDALDHLGIMLLELCFGRSLEEHPCRRGWPDGTSEKQKAAFDLLAAREWQCLVNEEAGPDYAEAVGCCLGGNRAAAPDRWRRDMLRTVIQPLKRSCDYLAGGYGLGGEEW